MKEEKHVCPECGKQFIAKGHAKGKQVYCSKRCRETFNARLQRNPLRTKICLWCKKEFRTRKKIKKYCSSLCAESYRYVRTRILKTIDFDIELTNKCMEIFEKNGIHSVFPVLELNAKISEVKETYERRKQKEGF